MRWVIRAGLVLAFSSPVAGFLVAYRWLEARAMSGPMVPSSESRSRPAPEIGRRSLQVGRSYHDRGSGKSWAEILLSQEEHLRDLTGTARLAGPMRPLDPSEFRIKPPSYAPGEHVGLPMPYEPNYLSSYGEDLLEINRGLKERYADTRQPF